jgi:nucleoside-diphosphate-sugar epimerase
MKLTVGVTGGTGFIGRRLIQSLIEEGFDVVSLQRSQRSESLVQIRHFDLSSIETVNDDLLKGIDVVIHAAALVHNASAKECQHNLLNYDVTTKLFNLSKVVGVKKFIFVSTVGVYGVSSLSSPIDINTQINPQTAYAKAKHLSETVLLEKSTSNIAVSVMRLPLVCGENAPGNYGVLEKISKSKLPLPFGMTKNKRSIVSVELVAKVLIDAAKDLDRYNGLQLLAEDPPVSTKDLVVQLRSHNSMSPNLVPVPKFMMKFLLAALGKRKIYEQLYEDLVFVSSINTEKYY